MEDSFKALVRDLLTDSWDVGKELLKFLVCFVILGTVVISIAGLFVLAILWFISLAKMWF